MGSVTEPAKLRSRNPTASDGRQVESTAFGNDIPMPCAAAPTTGYVNDHASEMAARAGVSLTVVKQAVRYAELDGLITVQRRPRSGKKHLTNIIRIIRVDWLTWLDKGHRKAYAIAACNRAKPDFPLAGGAQKNPPRSQDPGNSNRDRVDKTVKNGAGRGAR